MSEENRVAYGPSERKAVSALAFAVFFTPAEWKVLRALGADYRRFDALFSLREVERLRFLRRLYHQGALRP